MGQVLLQQDRLEGKVSHYFPLVYRQHRDITTPPAVSAASVWGVSIMVHTRQRNGCGSARSSVCVGVSVWVWVRVWVWVWVSCTGVCGCVGTDVCEQTRQPMVRWV